MMITTRNYIPHGENNNYLIPPDDGKNMSEWQKECRDEEAFVIVADNLGTGSGEACIAIGSPDMINNPWEASNRGEAIGILLDADELLDLINSLQLIYDNFGK